MAENYSEHVVEVPGYASSQTTNGFYYLGLLELDLDFSGFGLGPLAFRDIEPNPHQIELSRNWFRSTSSFSG
jgi:hypothetical protein